MESFVSNHLEDPDELLDQHREEILNEMNSKGVEKVTPKKLTDTSTILGKIKRNLLDNHDSEERPSKKTKLNKTEQEEVELYNFYKGKSNDELKDYMRYVLVFFTSLALFVFFLFPLNA